MSDDAVMTWRLGGVSLELRGDFALLPEHCADLEPIVTALGEFARKHGLAEGGERAQESRRMAVVHEVKEGEQVRVIGEAAPREGEVGTVYDIAESGGVGYPIAVEFPDGPPYNYLPRHLEWVGP